MAFKSILKSPLRPSQPKPKLSKQEKALIELSRRAKNGDVDAMNALNDIYVKGAAGLAVVGAAGYSEESEAGGLTLISQFSRIRKGASLPQREKVARELATIPELVATGFLPKGSIENKRSVQSAATKYVNAFMDSKPFRERRMLAYENNYETDVQLAKPEIEVKPFSSLIGKAGIGIESDRSHIGQINKIHGIDVPGGVESQGGFEHSVEKTGWASDEGIAQGRQNAADFVEQETGRPVVGSVNVMGQASQRYATPSSEIIIKQLLNTKSIKKKDVNAFDKKMREKYPEWVGLWDDRALAQLQGTSDEAPSLPNKARTYFSEIASLDEFKKVGFPSWEEIDMATVHPDLADLPINATGVAMFDMPAGQPITPSAEGSGHRSYSFDFSRGSKGFQLPIIDIPLEVIMPDAFKAQMRRVTAGQKGKNEPFTPSQAKKAINSLQSINERNAEQFWQVFDDEWYDNLMKWVRENRPGLEEAYEAGKKLGVIAAGSFGLYVVSGALSEYGVSQQTQAGIFTSAFKGSKGVLSKIQMNQGTKEQWISQLKKQGISQLEIDLIPWDQLPNTPIDKKFIEKFLEKNRPQVEVVDTTKARTDEPLARKIAAAQAMAKIPLKDAIAKLKNKKARDSAKEKIFDILKKSKPGFGKKKPGTEAVEKARLNRDKKAQAAYENHFKSLVKQALKSEDPVAFLKNYGIDLPEEELRSILGEKKAPKSKSKEIAAPISKERTWQLKNFVNFDPEYLLEGAFQDFMLDATKEDIFNSIYEEIRNQAMDPRGEQANWVGAFKPNEETVAQYFLRRLKDTRDDLPNVPEGEDPYDVMPDVDADQWSDLTDLIEQVEDDLQNSALEHIVDHFWHKVYKHDPAEEKLLRETARDIMVQDYQGLVGRGDSLRDYLSKWDGWEAWDYWEDVWGSDDGIDIEELGLVDRDGDTISDIDELIDFQPMEIYEKLKDHDPVLAEEFIRHVEDMAIGYNPEKLRETDFYKAKKLPEKIETMTRVPESSILDIPEGQQIVVQHPDLYDQRFNSQYEADAYISRMQQEQGLDDFEYFLDDAKTLVSFGAWDAGFSSDIVSGALDANDIPPVLDSIVRDIYEWDPNKGWTLSEYIDDQLDLEKTRLSEFVEEGSPEWDDAVADIEKAHEIVERSRTRLDGLQESFFGWQEPNISGRQVDALIDFIKSKADQITVEEIISLVPEGNQTQVLENLGIYADSLADLTPTTRSTLISELETPVEDLAFESALNEVAIFGSRELKEKYNLGWDENQGLYDAAYAEELMATPDAPALPAPQEITPDQVARDVIANITFTGDDATGWGRAWLDFQERHPEAQGFSPLVYANSRPNFMNNVLEADIDNEINDIIRMQQQDLPDDFVELQTAAYSVAPDHSIGEYIVLIEESNPQLAQQLTDELIEAQRDHMREDVLAEGDEMPEAWALQEDIMNTGFEDAPISDDLTNRITHAAAEYGSDYFRDTNFYQDSIEDLTFADDRPTLPAQTAQTLPVPTPSLPVFDAGNFVEEFFSANYNPGAPALDARAGLEDILSRMQAMGMIEDFDPSRFTPTEYVLSAIDEWIEGVIDGVADVPFDEVPEGWYKAKSLLEMEGVNKRFNPYFEKHTGFPSQGELLERTSRSSEFIESYASTWRMIEDLVEPERADELKEALISEMILQRSTRFGDQLTDEEAIAIIMENDLLELHKYIYGEGMPEGYRPDTDWDISDEILSTIIDHSPNVLKETDFYKTIIEKRPSESAALLEQLFVGDKPGALSGIMPGESVSDAVKRIAAQNEEAFLESYYQSWLRTDTDAPGAAYLKLKDEIENYTKLVEQDALGVEAQTDTGFEYRLAKKQYDEAVANETKANQEQIDLETQQLFEEVRSGLEKLHNIQVEPITSIDDLLEYSLSDLNPYQNRSSIARLEPDRRRSSSDDIDLQILDAFLDDFAGNPANKAAIDAEVNLQTRGAATTPRGVQPDDQPQSKNMVLPGAKEDYRHIYFNMKGDTSKTGHMSGQPGNLGWVRGTIRELPDGRKVLMIEELQFDVMKRDERLSDAQKALKAKMPKRWQKNALHGILKYAQDEGLDGVTFASRPLQVSEIEQFGFRSDDLSTWDNQSRETVARQYVEEFPKHIKKITGKKPERVALDTGEEVNFVPLKDDKGKKTKLPPARFWSLAPAAGVAAYAVTESQPAMSSELMEEYYTDGEPNDPKLEPDVYLKANPEAQDTDIVDLDDYILYKHDDGVYRSVPLPELVNESTVEMTEDEVRNTAEEKWAQSLDEVSWKRGRGRDRDEEEKLRDFEILEEEEKPAATQWQLMKGELQKLMNIYYTGYDDVDEYIDAAQQGSPDIDRQLYAYLVDAASKQVKKNQAAKSVLPSEQRQQEEYQAEKPETIQVEDYSNELIETGQQTYEGKPIYQNVYGDIVTENSITVTDDRINDGMPTNIPTVYGGQVLSDEEAIEMAVELDGVDQDTGQPFEYFDSIEEAEQAAQERSDWIGENYADAGRYDQPYASMWDRDTTREEREQIGKANVEQFAKQVVGAGEVGYQILDALAGEWQAGVTGMSVGGMNLLADTIESAGSPDMADYLRDIVGNTSAAEAVDITREQRGNLPGASIDTKYGQQMMEDFGVGMQNLIEGAAEQPIAYPKFDMDRAVADKDFLSGFYMHEGKGADIATGWSDLWNWVNSSIAEVAPPEVAAVPATVGSMLPEMF